jgi:predicted nucleotidyltransferase component of viral defense system
VALREDLPRGKRDEALPGDGPMTKARPTNLAASVHQRLLNLANEKGEDFNPVLTWYGRERLLYRLTKSEHADKFVLKGAMLFPLWTELPHRPTRDLDLLGYGEASSEQVRQLFQDICIMEVEPDGLKFDADSVRVDEIREGQEYEGQRVRIPARLGNARIDLQIDIGFGDAVTPDAKEIEYPTLLDFPAPRLRAYPPETVVVEKLQAMVFWGMANSRMKDFYDLWIISKRMSFDGAMLVEAMRATFDRRETPIPTERPTALSREFATDSVQIGRWRGFLGRTSLKNAPVELSRVVEDLREFVTAPLLAAAKDKTFDQTWDAGGPWRGQT